MVLFVALDFCKIPSATKWNQLQRTATKWNGLGNHELTRIDTNRSGKRPEFGLLSWQAGQSATAANGAGFVRGGFWDKGRCDQGKRDGSRGDAEGAEEEVGEVDG